MSLLSQFPRLAPVLRPAWLAACLALAGAVTPAAAAAPAAELTSISAVHALTPEQAAAALPARVRGVVTRATNYELFLQDGPDAIFIWQRAPHPELQLGDYVEIRGTTSTGHLFPLVKEEQCIVLERRALPEPRLVRFSDLASGRSDCQWVEVSGVVRAAELRLQDCVTLQLAFDGGLLRVELARSVDLPAQLVGAQVRVRGVISGVKTPQRLLIEPVLWATLEPGTFQLVAPGPSDLFAAAAHPVGALLDYGGAGLAGQMVRIAGVVTCQVNPRLLFIRDHDACLEIRLQQPAALAVGDRIEAVGFPEMGTSQPILQNAVARRVANGPPPVPRRIAAAHLLDFANEAELVEVEGELLEIFRHRNGATLLLSEGGAALNVDVDTARPEAAAALPPVGSRIAVVGVCQIDRLLPPDRFQLVAPASMRVRLRSTEDLRVLSQPSWWDTRRLLTAIAGLSVFALGALGWIWLLDRRVRQQTRIILGNVERSAMLEERNRIARELHDTIEQQLAGVIILLDAIATAVTRQPERVRDGLGTARAMLRHSLDEAQEAVADLRNNDLFERDFRPLLEEAVRERLRATAIQVEFQSVGEWPELDTVVKKHLLRMVQEAVTNAAKHARPGRITVALLAAGDRLELQVSDDGCGFAVDDLPRRGPGEFGLIGLQERAEKIGARLAIQSAPGRGTTIAISLHHAAPAVAV